MTISSLAATLAAILAVFVAALWLSVPNANPLRTEIPADTAFMRLRQNDAQAAKRRNFKIRKTWVPLRSISTSLQRAVIVSEDAAFYSHSGVDFDEMRASLEKNIRKGRFVRGGSTLTQQLAKNLYLSPSRNPIRKIREVLIARELEQKLTKARILELYLNLIEWGDGVFGAEAAARHYFSTSASNLTPEQAALLAAIIPNPRRFGKSLQSKRVQRKKSIILARMRRGGPAIAAKAPELTKPEAELPVADEIDEVEDELPVDETTPASVPAAVEPLIQDEAQ